MKRKNNKSSREAERLREIASRSGKIGGTIRMAALSDKERIALASKGGRAGAKARADSLTPERRREIAREAARARWAKT